MQYTWVPVTIDQKIASLAEKNSFFLYHYEYRSPLLAPEDWFADPEYLEWQQGILSEGKYQSFRSDSMIGSFHPGQDARWSSHELCHRLVGFAWKPEASLLYIALSARMAELVPVLQFHFLSQGETRLAKIFLDKELKAIRQSIQKKTWVSHSWGALDLSSDAALYAKRHERRLQHPAHIEYMQKFYTEKTGCLSTLKALEERLIHVYKSILDEEIYIPWQGDEAIWMSQDLGYRCLELALQSEKDLRQDLEKISQALAENPTHAGIQNFVKAYEALYENWELPPPTTFFAVGYNLGSYGFSEDLISEGLWSIFPRSLEKILKHTPSLVSLFASKDRGDRRYLGFRFLDFLKNFAEKNVLESVELELYLQLPRQFQEQTWNLGSSVGMPSMVCLAKNVKLLKVSTSCAKSMALDYQKDFVCEDSLFVIIQNRHDGYKDIYFMPYSAGEKLLSFQGNSFKMDELGLDSNTQEIWWQQEIVLASQWAI